MVTQPYFENQRLMITSYRLCQALLGCNRNEQQDICVNFHQHRTFKNPAGGTIFRAHAILRNGDVCSPTDWETAYNFLLDSLCLTRSKTYLFLRASHLALCIRAQVVALLLPPTLLGTSGSHRCSMCIGMGEDTDLEKASPWRHQPLLQYHKEQSLPKGMELIPSGFACFFSGHNTTERHCYLTKVNPDFGSCYWISKIGKVDAECQTHAILFHLSIFGTTLNALRWTICHQYLCRLPKKSRSKLHLVPGPIQSLLIHMRFVPQKRSSSMQFILFLKPQQKSLLEYRHRSASQT